MADSLWTKSWSVLPRRNQEPKCQENNRRHPALQALAQVLVVRSHRRNQCRSRIKHHQRWSAVLYLYSFYGVHGSDFSCRLVGICGLNRLAVVALNTTSLYVSTRNKGVKANSRKVSRIEGAKWPAALKRTTETGCRMNGFPVFDIFYDSNLLRGKQ